ncbi:sulfotransferase [Microbulbifer sp. CnH-101-G]|uniref:sulfotransferase n=1 Tax=Microbulbifer sp. CnH-101-G TaxID=3243393 RepID=UPI00403A171D
MINSPPVIIFGNPRSGTRMCANILNLHPDICITDEFYNVQMLSNFANKQIASFIENRVDPATIALRKELLVKSYWIFRSNIKQVEKSFNSKIVGNKTPRSENFFDLYEEIFSVNKPIYIYCARNAYDVLRSIKNLKNILWGNLPFEEIFENYKKSYRIYTKIKKSYPIRTFEINVNMYNKKNVFFHYKQIFDMLGVDYDDEFIEKVNSLAPQNTLHRVKEITKDESPIKELTAEEMKLISSCKEYAKIKESWSFAS